VTYSMKIIGVTGVFGSGKSEAARMIAKEGAYLIDHDQINHDLLIKGEPGYDAILREYGKGILNGDDQIIRSKVAALAFKSEASVQRICSLLHPLIIVVEQELVRKFKRDKEHGTIVFDSPLLFESGRDAVCDHTIVISSDEEKLYKRIKKSFGLDKDEARRRLFYQMSTIEKVKRADYVIENNGTLAELKESVKSVLKRIKDGE